MQTILVFLLRHFGKVISGGCLHDAASIGFTDNEVKALRSVTNDIKSCHDHEAAASPHLCYLAGGLFFPALTCQLIMVVTL